MANARQLTFPFPHLRFSPDILRRLGEELNPNPDQGILELVKNAHDADASVCSIELSGTSAPGGMVSITDDGVGMDRDAIESSWLLLGKSSKDSTVLTNLGRVPVGNKGLGRLAALRLGTLATLISSPKSDPLHEYVLTIDWTKYDAVESVEEVELKIKRRHRAELRGHGTIIRIENLRDALQRNDAKRLARGVLLLADPFGDNPLGFRPELVSPEFDDLAKQVQKRYFEDAEFHLVANVDQQGLGSAKVLDWKGNELYAAGHEELRRKLSEQPYSCPPISFDLWNFLLKKESFSTRGSTIQEVQDWLGVFGGVHLYLRGFRVPPYGNPGNDWLDMNLSRAASPEERPSTNNSIGRVAVKVPGMTLVQKTDRSGLIEDSAFEQLKIFAEESLRWMARRRLSERDAKRKEEKSRSAARTTKAKENFDSVVDSLPKPHQKGIKQAFDQYDKAREKETVSLRKEVQLYRTLSTAGITAALFSHESKQPLDLIEKNAKIVRQSVEKFLDVNAGSKIFPALDRLLGVTDTLRAFGNLTLSQVDRDKRRARRVDIHVVIHDVSEMFDRFIAQRKATLELSLADCNPYLRTSAAAVESVITNLIMNSLQSFENAPPGKHRIVLKTLVSSSICAIVCSDSGPGIFGIKPSDVWLPGETTRENGTGLGLTIVRDTVADLGGAVDAISHGSDGGAEFRITLPILGTK
jgi:nitrogen-specific signal transduction histidine kinase